MLKIYGSDLCPDCIRCKADLDAAGVPYEYQSITEDLRSMKEFLKIREESAAFAAAKENGSIGIPCLISPEGEVSLSWEQYL
jgi:glutaredoxin-related protein